jgi:hypothetical protein
MKKAGIVIFVIGLLLTVLTGFKFFTKEKIVDIGSVQISASKPHRVNWSPYLGAGIMVAGVVVYLVGNKK